VEERFDATLSRILGTDGLAVDRMFFNLETLSEYVALQEAVKSIDGWLRTYEGYLLYLLARYGPGTGEIVEIGSFMGLSTCWLAFGTSRAGREKVTAVDTFQGGPEYQGTTLSAFEDNIARLGLSDFVRPLVGKSQEVAATWTRPIRLLFIDGDHSHEQCSLDFQSWSPFMIHGGCIAFHDYGVWPGVTEFYNESISRNTSYQEVVSAGSLRVIQMCGATQAGVSS
jgi:predicted O-methyltransferase YrrM